MPVKPLQPREAIEGEIEFRRKLCEQQTGGKQYFEDEMSQERLVETLRSRMRTTQKDMKELWNIGVILNNYLEVGAERCQRSMAMEAMGLHGMATDLSEDMLKSKEFWAEKLGVRPEHVPGAVPADIHDLPFRDGTFDFVFCYEFLHHFPRPDEPIQEIARVLKPGGHFFFADEPFKKTLHLNLIKGRKLYSKGALRMGKLDQAIEYFLAEKRCNETEYGIIENDNITIQDWRRALKPFRQTRVTLRTVGDRWCTLDKPTIMHRLLGGQIRGVCQK